ncbi:cytochrome P450 67 [Sphaerosporella brunnea]|uniref:Cytochrome P450 67 n=1 Tax=Sphaerosporella brunnea TaxID=1250544 RepID=A0A5J5ER50_9PEZI|nr:cytochrome P450 67 [Sphaerosporella brunnea]
MNTEPVVLSVSAAAALAICFHISIIPHEIDFKIKRLLGLYVASIAGLYYLLHRETVTNPGTVTVLSATVFNAALTASILIHRMFLHRAGKFPGPFMARVSKFYSVFLSVKKMQYHKEVEQLHRKYGDFVRTGPREVSVIRASAVQTIYGAQSTCSRAPFYSQVADHPNCSLHASRDRVYHNLRRRAWDRGFSTAMLKDYEPRMGALTDLLIAQLRSRVGTPVDITTWSNYYSFDVMGDVGFGKSWGMLESGKLHKAINELHAAMALLGYIGQVPWLSRLLMELPAATKALKGFQDWCWKQMEEKKKAVAQFRPIEAFCWLAVETPSFGPWGARAVDSWVSVLPVRNLSAATRLFGRVEVLDKPRDLITWLLTDSKLDTKLPSQAINEDSRLIIIAGSDTTASTLAHAFYFLAKYPGAYKKLQNVLDAAFPGGDAEFSNATACGLKFLEGVIFETLRLKPAVPGGMLRMTPPEGLTIDEVYIPGDVVVSVPTHSIQRDERYYEKASEFIPERWMDEKAHMVKDKRAFIPFSKGTFGCVGKNLALMELRMVLAKVALNFELEFAEGENGSRIEEETKDTFTLTVTPLFVIFKEREK